MFREETLNRCQELALRGCDIDDVIRELRLAGLSKVESMKVLPVYFGLASLADANEKVHASAVWADVRERDEAFHRALTQSFADASACEAGLNFALIFNDLSAAGEVRSDYDPELDSIMSILSETCEALESAGVFVIRGFGRGVWYTDLYTELCIFLEQLPVSLLAIQARTDFPITFYEQGLELRLEFSADGERYVARCVPMLGPAPDTPPTEFIEASILHVMFQRVMDEFLRALRERYPALLDHPWMRDWLDGEPV
ncbi:MAG TPA: hypothetical protein VM555_08260 [Tahibacter sp.]|jgi:hypothetical protein|nr:hypothetical protein [Tahibacter sp.]